MNWDVLFYDAVDAEFKAQCFRKAQHPLTDRGLGQDVVDRQGPTHVYAPGATTRTTTPALATEDHPLFLVTGRARHAQKALFQAPGLEVLPEFPPDVLGQWPAPCGHQVRECGIVLRHSATGYLTTRKPLINSSWRGTM